MAACVSPVVIVVAGVGGLTLALLLRSRGIAAEVLEQSAELREVGAAVGLAANGTRVLHHLGLGESLARVSTEPTRLSHRDGRDGEPVSAMWDSQSYRERFGAPLLACTEQICSSFSWPRSAPTTCIWAAEWSPCARTAPG